MQASRLVKECISLARKMANGSVVIKAGTNSNITSGGRSSREHQYPTKAHITTHQALKDIDMLILKLSRKEKGSSNSFTLLIISCS
jgi:hypothetical protein